ncbi:MAG: hypothetical protein ACOCRO_09900 [Halanaerobiales bacterium]
MENIKEGMYVRCPIYLEKADYFNPRSFIIGQVNEVYEENNEVLVSFYDFNNLRTYFAEIIPKEDEDTVYSIEEIQRCQIQDDSEVIIKE